MKEKRKPDMIGVVWRRYAPADYRQPFTVEVGAEELGPLLCGIQHWHRRAGVVTYDDDTKTYTVHAGGA